MLGPTLLLGLLMGARHALEVDHVATVAALAARTGSLRSTLRVASFWGFGHGAVLFVAGAIMIGVGAVLPVRAAAALEIVVGAILILLGIDVLRRLGSRGVHFHVHRHGDGKRHLHAHAHESEAIHDPDHHEHEHVARLLPRAALVGAVHGLAGSAAIVLVSLQTMASTAHALAYLAVYGLGSMIGMMAFSVVIFLPFNLSASPVGRASRVIQAALGATSVAIGCWVMLRVGLS